VYLPRSALADESAAADVRRCRARWQRNGADR
jgi:hypothetical protein